METCLKSCTMDNEGERSGNQVIFSRFFGDEGNRTPDLLNAIQALSQLSYAPGLDFSDM